MRPVMNGLCKYESIKDCSLDLEDVARMNEALDAKDENEKRFRKAHQ